MKKNILVLIMLLGARVYAGQVALPVERLALPQVQGNHLICIWDETASNWHASFASYDHGGSISFQVPEWDKWYWVGLWDEEAGQYVFGKWVGHFVTN